MNLAFQSYRRPVRHLGDEIAPGSTDILSRVNCAVGYDISLSASDSKSLSTGPTQFGNAGNSGIIFGGSNGFSTKTVLLIVGGLVAVWWFFLRRGRK